MLNIKQEIIWIVNLALHVKCWASVHYTIFHIFIHVNRSTINYQIRGFFSDWESKRVIACQTQWEECPLNAIVSILSLQQEALPCFKLNSLTPLLKQQWEESRTNALSICTYIIHSLFLLPNYHMSAFMHCSVSDILVMSFCTAKFY